MNGGKKPPGKQSGLKTGSPDFQTFFFVFAARKSVQAIGAASV